MKKTVMYIFFLFFIIGLASCGDRGRDRTVATTADSAKANMTDTTKTDKDSFIMKAASGGLMEVKLGEYAEKNAATKAVKDFGRRMVKDHSKANAELKALAAKKDITLPTELNEDHQKMWDDLTKKTGKDFDKEYMSQMVDDHETDVKEFQDASENEKDADLKTWAGKTLPVLKQHLELAKNVKDKLK